MFRIFIIVLVLSTFQLRASEMEHENQTIELVYGSGDVNHAIIWLHGLGASSNDFPPIVPELGLKPDRAIRFIFPQAPDRPITINGGMVMPGWYDIKGVSIEDKQDAQGMSESQLILDKLIQGQIDNGISNENIILAGFSQGGAVTYHTGLRSKHKLAGLITLSTYLPFAEDVSTERSSDNYEIPIFASHGKFDPVVPIALGKISVEKLTSMGYKIEWSEYPMEHQVVMEQIIEIGKWINQTFD